MTTIKKTDNGNGKGCSDWDRKAHNVEFMKLFDKKRVEEVRELDEMDKAAYDIVDEMIVKIHDVRARLKHRLEVFPKTEKAR